MIVDVPRAVTFAVLSGLLWRHTPPIVAELGSDSGSVLDITPVKGSALAAALGEVGDALGHWAG